MQCEWDQVLQKRGSEENCCDSPRKKRSARPSPTGGEVARADAIKFLERCKLDSSLLSPPAAFW